MNNPTPSRLQKNLTTTLVCAVVILGGVFLLMQYKLHSLENITEYARDWRSNSSILNDQYENGQCAIAYFTATNGAIQKLGEYEYKNRPHTWGTYSHPIYTFESNDGTVYSLDNRTAKNGYVDTVHMAFQKYNSESNTFTILNEITLDRDIPLEWVKESSQYLYFSQSDYTSQNEVHQTIHRLDIRTEELMMILDTNSQYTYIGTTSKHDVVLQDAQSNIVLVTPGNTAIQELPIVRKDRTIVGLAPKTNTLISVERSAESPLELTVYIDNVYTSETSTFSFELLENVKGALHTVLSPSGSQIAITLSADKQFYLYVIDINAKNIIAQGKVQIKPEGFLSNENSTLYALQRRYPPNGLSYTMLQILTEENEVVSKPLENGTFCRLPMRVRYTAKGDAIFVGQQP